MKCPQCKGYDRATRIYVSPPLNTKYPPYRGGRGGAIYSERAKLLDLSHGLSGKGILKTKFWSWLSGMNVALVVSFVKGVQANGTKLLHHETTQAL